MIKKFRKPEVVMCMHWAGVLTKVTVFSLHIFTHNHIILTLKTDMCNTQTHSDTLLLFISYLSDEITETLNARIHNY